MGAISPAETCLTRGHVFSLSPDIFDRKLEGVQEQILVLGEQCRAGDSAGENGFSLFENVPAVLGSLSPLRLFSMFLDLLILAP